MSTSKSRSRVPASVRGKADGISAAQIDHPDAPNTGTGMPDGGIGSGPSDLLAEYLRKEDLAQQFGVCTRTIERWVRLRLIPAPVRLGRTSLYHLPTIRKHLARQLQPGHGRRRRS